MPNHLGDPIQQNLTLSPPPQERTCIKVSEEMLSVVDMTNRLDNPIEAELTSM